MNNYKFKNFNIFVADDLYEKYETDKDFLAHELIENLYSKFMLILNNNLVDGLVIRNFSNTKMFYLYKSDIVKYLKDYNFSDVGEMRLHHINDLTNYDKFINDYNDSVHKTILNNKIYSIHVSDIIKILNCDDLTFRLFLNNKVALKYDVKIMLYLIIDFVNKEHILYRYKMSDQANLRINYIKKLFNINYEVQFNDSFVDDSLKYLEGITGYSKLKDAIIIFNNMKDDNALNFLSTYTRLLHYIGIYPFINDQDLYGDILTFHYGEFDIALNDNKIICTNDNQITQKKFEAIYGDVLKLDKEGENDLSYNKKR